MNDAVSKPLPPPEVSIYRAATIRMLRRYFNMSVELGRLPCIMGREVFRSDVHCRPTSFENFVIYVLDIERCVQRLRRRDQELITRVVLQEYTQEEAARLLGCPVIYVERRLPEVLDTLTETFLKLGLMKLPQKRYRTKPVEQERPAPVNNSIVENICAAARSDRAGTRFVPLRNCDVQEISHDVPVEIFLSSPPNVTNPANCLVQ